MRSPRCLHSPIFPAMLGTLLLAAALPAPAVCPPLQLPSPGRLLGYDVLEGEADQAYAWMGYAVRTAGDVNGDGYSDVLVGSPLRDGAFVNEGRVDLYLGAKEGISNVSAWFAVGTGTSTIFGAAVSTAGDVNGDGYDDVIVGEPGYSNGETFEGRAYVYLGSASGLSLTPDWMVEIDVVNAQLGGSVSTAGDVNGDGYDDVIVGAPGLGEAGTLFQGQGGAYVYLGSASGLDTNYQLAVSGGQADAEMGRSVCTAGDVNGDGYDDVIVGLPFAENTIGGAQGQARVFLGSSTGVQSTPVWSKFGELQSGYGYSVATAGDMNGDGYSEIIVGAKDHVHLGTDAGAVFIVAGSASGPNDAITKVLYGCEANEDFGASVFTAGDVNGDGLADVIVGAPLKDRTPSPDNGGYYVYVGHHQFYVDLVAKIVEVSAKGGAKYGISVGSAGDVNGDGFGDVIIGEPNYTSGELEEGAFRVYPGQGLPTTNWTHFSKTGGQFEAFLGVETCSAGDLDGDGFDDIVVDRAFYDFNGTDRGGILVYYGSAAGIVDPPLELYGENAGDTFGRGIAAAGDVNGDGFDDLLVGAARFSVGAIDRGRVYCYHGSASGLQVTPAWSIDGEIAETYLWRVAGAGDVNGDGFADALVAAPGWDGVQPDMGKAWLYLGGPSGLSTTPVWSFEGQEWLGFLGEIAAAGDIDGDGYGDILVGVGNEGAILGEGVARMFLGGADGPSATPDWEISGGSIGAALEAVAAAGDVDADGYADVIVGARYFDNSLGGTGVAWVYRGTAAGLQLQPNTTLQISQLDSEFGRSVGTAGDVNGDGYSDVVVGATWYSPVESNEGGYFLYFGSKNGILPQSVASIRGGQQDMYLGRSVGTAGDVDGDGFSDVLVGAYGYDFGQVDEGGAFILLGNGDDAGERMAITAHQHDDATARIPHLGRATQTIELGVRGRNAAGRTHMRLEWSLQPLGDPHPAQGNFEAWVESGAVDPVLGSVVDFSRSVTPAKEDMSYTWRVRVWGDSPFFPRSPWRTQSGTVPSLAQFRSHVTPTDTEAAMPSLPVRLLGASPNPFNPRTVLHYSIAREGRVRVDVIDLRGRRVAVLLDAVQPAGEYRLPWQGVDDRGGPVASGVYIVQVQSEDGVDRRKVTLLK